MPTDPSLYKAASGRTLTMPRSDGPASWNRKKVWYAVQKGPILSYGSRNAGQAGQLMALLWMILALLTIAPAQASADNGFLDWVEVFGRISTDVWHYPDSAAYPDQRSYLGGLALETTVYMEHEDGRSITLTPFFRYDAGDPERTYVDLQEAYLLTYGDTTDGEWEVRLGFDRVFWGVVESRPLVNIVNQTNPVEHPNEQSKLGQPMLHYTLSSGWGILEFFGITWHRERLYPGRHGRQRTGLIVTPELTSYESAAKEWHLDFASRYSHRLGPLDIGISLFDGTNREPTLLPVTSGSQLVLAPHYEQVRQYGLDAQLTTGALLLKLETIHRAGARNARLQEDDYMAFVIGGEYTINSVWDSKADLGLFVEWAYDDRGQWATNAFENDLFLAAHLGLNDVSSTEFVVSLLASRDNSSHILGVEFSRRLSDQWYLNTEVSRYLEIDDAVDVLYPVRRDSYVRVNLDYNF